MTRKAREEKIKLLRREIWDLTGNPEKEIRRQMIAWNKTREEAEKARQKRVSFLQATLETYLKEQERMG